MTISMSISTGEKQMVLFSTLGRAMEKELIQVQIGTSTGQPEVKEKLRAAVKAAWAKRKANQCLGGKISNTYPDPLDKHPADAGLFCF